MSILARAATEGHCLAQLDSARRLRANFRVLDPSAWADENAEQDPPRNRDAKHDAWMAARFDDATRERIVALAPFAAWPWDERGAAAMVEINRIWDQCGAWPWQHAEPEPLHEPAANDSPLIQQHVGTWTDVPVSASASPKNTRRQPKPTRRSYPRNVLAAARRLAPRLYLEIERHREDGIARSALRRFAATVVRAKARAADVGDAALARLVDARKVVRQQVGRVVRFVASLFVAGAAERAEPAARHEDDVAGDRIQPCAGRPRGAQSRGPCGPEIAGTGARSVPTSPRLLGFASRRGQVGRVPRPPTSFASVFWRKVERPNTRASGCREWLGSLDRDGYGRYGRHDRAHRTAFEIHYGVRLTTDLVVMHGCDNPSCCNPQHLSIGRHDDNMRDRKAKGRY